MRHILFSLFVMIAVFGVQRVQAVQPFMISDIKSGATQEEDKFRLSLAFPDDWKVVRVEPSEASNATGYLGTLFNTTASAGIYHAKLQGEESFDDLVKRESAIFTENFPGSEIIKTETRTMPNEATLKHVVYKYQEKNQFAILSIDFYLWHNNVYWLEFVANAKDWLKHENDFKEINDSVYMLLTDQR